MRALKVGVAVCCTGIGLMGCAARAQDVATTTPVAQVALQPPAPAPDAERPLVQAPPPKPRVIIPAPPLDSEGPAASPLVDAYPERVAPNGPSATAPAPAPAPALAAFTPQPSPLLVGADSSPRGKAPKLDPLVSEYLEEARERRRGWRGWSGLGWSWGRPHYGYGYGGWGSPWGYGYPSYGWGSPYGYGYGPGIGLGLGFRSRGWGGGWRGGSGGGPRVAGHGGERF